MSNGRAKRWAPPAAAMAMAMAIGGVCQAQQPMEALDPSAGYATGINANGDVIFDAHIRLGGVLSELGVGTPITENGPAASTWPMNRGTALNDDGEAVGTLQNHAAFRDSAGNVSDQGVAAGLSPSLTSEALGINNAGTMVGAGSASANGGMRYGWYGPAGGPLTRLVPPNYSDDGAAHDINEAGLITGFFSRQGSGIYFDHVAYIFDTQTSQWTELGIGVGRAINELGEVAGSLTTDRCGRAFVHRNGVNIDIGNFGRLCSHALDINDHGNVVGTSDTNPNGEYHPFLFNGALQDVIDLIPANDPYKTTAEVTEAVAINNDGVIVLNGLDKLNWPPKTTPKRRAWLLQVPQVYFEGGVQDFGEVAAGATSAAKAITLTNKSAAAVTIDSILMRGSFAQTNDCPPSLGAGASCTFTVTFTPQAAGSHTGGLTVSINGTSFRTQASGQTPMPVTLSISTANVVAGVPFTLSWTAPAGSTCWGTGNAVLLGSTIWSNAKAASGSESYKVPVAGANSIGLQCTLNGATGLAPDVQFTAAVPTVTATLTPSTTTVYAGTTFTLTWTSTLADECTPSGDDPTWVTPWRPANGSLVIAAPSSVSTPVQYTYTLRCDNFANHVSATAQAVITLNPGPPPAQQPPPQSQNPPPSSGGGGGSLDRGLLLGLALALIAGFAGRRREVLARRSAR